MKLCKGGQGRTDADAREAGEIACYIGIMWIVIIACLLLLAVFTGLVGG